MGPPLRSPGVRASGHPEDSDYEPPSTTPRIHPDRAARAVTRAAAPITVLQAENGLDPEGSDALVVAHTGELDGPNSIPAHAD